MDVDGYLLVVVRDPGGSWREAQNLGSFDAEPTVSVSDRGDALVAWWAGDGTGARRLQVSRRLPSGGFGAVEALGAATEYTYGFSDGFSADGDAFVLWATADRTRVPVQVPVQVAVAAPGAPFTGTSLGTIAWRGRAAPSVAPDGRALVALPAKGALLVADRALVALPAKGALLVAERAPGAPFGAPGAAVHGGGPGRVPGRGGERQWRPRGDRLYRQQRRQPADGDAHGTGCVWRAHGPSIRRGRPLATRSTPPSGSPSFGDLGPGFFGDAQDLALTPDGRVVFTREYRRTLGGIRRAACVRRPWRRPAARRRSRSPAWRSRTSATRSRLCSPTAARRWCGQRISQPSASVCTWRRTVPPLGHNRRRRPCTCARPPTR